MSRLIKVIDNETIEIADYRNPEATFKSSQNPPTLQDVKNEIEHLEWYCMFKDTINPFQMYEENKRLNNIINELEKTLDENVELTYIHNGIRQYNKTLTEGGLLFRDYIKSKLQELKGSNNNE